MQNDSKKNIPGIVFKVFTWCVLVFAVLMMIFTIVSVTTLDRNDRSIFGLRLFVDLTDSMSPDHFSAGDLVIVKKVKDVSTIEPGDIVTYQSLMEGETYGKPVTHMVRSNTVNRNGVRELVTYGTATGVDDELKVNENFVLGKYVGHVPKLGYFFQYLHTTVGYIFCILLPFLLLIGGQGVRCVKIFKKYKGEQLDLLDAQKAQIEAERAESQRMLAELEALKAELAARETKEKEPAPDEKRDL